MDCMVQESGDEIIFLKKKCNALLDTIENLKYDLKKEEELQKEAEIIPEFLKEPEMLKPYYFDETEEIYMFFQSLKIIIKKALEGHTFIEYAYSSKYSAEFCKIEKNEFNKLIDELSSIEGKKFIDYCVDFLFLKAEHSRKCVYTSDKMQIYYLRRCIVRMLGGEAYIQKR